METTLSREAFLRVLESVKPGLAVREILEQSVCIVFHEGDAVTYNDETSVRCPSGLPKDFSGAVQAKQMLECLQRIEGDTIRVSSDGDVFTLGVKGTLVECALESDVRLPLAAVEKPGKYRKLHQDFVDAVHLVQACAGKDETRSSLTCVHVHPEWVEASDNYQACRWKLATGVKESTLLKRASVDSLSSLGVTEMSEGENWAHFKSPRGVVLSCRRYVEEYPSDSITPYLEQDGESVSLPKQLKEACELANVFSQENADANLIRVDVKPGSPGRVTVTGQGLTGKVRKSLACNWSGNAITFMISPSLLGELVGKHNQVLLNEEIIKVDGGSYVYVTMLSTPQDVAEAAETNKKKGKKKGKAEDGD